MRNRQTFKTVNFWTSINMAKIIYYANSLLLCYGCKKNWTLNKEKQHQQQQNVKKYFKIETLQATKKQKKKKKRLSQHV